MEATPREAAASLDRRVENLERAQADTQRAVDRLELGQANLKEVMDLRFRSLESQITGADLRVVALDQKFDTLSEFLQKAMADSVKLAADVQATPAGRMIASEIAELEAGRQKNTDAIESLKAKFFMISGGLAVLITLMNILSPNIRQLFDLAKTAGG